MPRLISAALALVGVIHLLPVFGVLGSEQLSTFYGLDFSDPSLAILMRHRAVLFGLLGAFLLYAAFNRSLHAIALLAATVSVVSFLALAWSTGGYNPLIAKIVAADILALVALAVGGVAFMASRRGG